MLSNRKNFNNAIFQSFKISFNEPIHEAIHSWSRIRIMYQIYPNHLVAFNSIPINYAHYIFLKQNIESKTRWNIDERYRSFPTRYSNDRTLLNYHTPLLFFSPSTWHVFQWSWYVDLLLVSYARDSTWSRGLIPLSILGIATAFKLPPCHVSLPFRWPPQNHEGRSTLLFSLTYLRSYVIYLPFDT